MICILLVSAGLSAQDPQEAEVQRVIETFFRGFHAKDSLTMQAAVSDRPILQTIGRNKDGKLGMRSENMDDLIKSIVSIPDSVNFQEKIKSYSIRIDGAMANAWTPYEFWINDNFSHCGVNSFQLFNDGEGWKVIYLIDTRRRDDCE